MDSNPTIDINSFRSRAFDTNMDDTVRTPESELVENVKEFSVLYTDINDLKGDYILSKLKKHTDTIIKVSTR